MWTSSIGVDESFKVLWDRKKSFITLFRVYGQNLSLKLEGEIKNGKYVRQRMNIKYFFIFSSSPSFSDLTLRPFLDDVWEFYKIKLRWWRINSANHSKSIVERKFLASRPPRLKAKDNFLYCEKVKAYLSNFFLLRRP